MSSLKSALKASEGEAPRIALVKRIVIAALLVVTILAVIGGGIAEFQRNGTNTARAEVSDEGQKAQTTQSAAEIEKIRADAHATHAEIRQLERRLAESY